MVPTAGAEAARTGGTEDVPDCRFDGVGLASVRPGVTLLACAAVPDAGISAGAAGSAVVCAKAIVARLEMRTKTRGCLKTVLQGFRKARSAAIGIPAICQLSA